MEDPVSKRGTIGSMDWDNLKVALAVSRTGSLTQAAAVLNIDRSTAGRRLSALEADLGSILFIRTKTGFAVTDAGEAAVSRAQEIQSQIDLMIDEVVGSDDGPVGVVRLVGHAWLLQRLMRMAVPSYLSAHPQLDLRFVNEASHGTIRSGATLSLWFEVEPRDGEFAIRLGDIPYAVYCAREFKDTRLDWVSFHDEERTHPLIAKANDQLRGESETSRITATDAGIMLLAIRQGVGKGLLPMCLAEEDSNLVRVEPGEPEFVRSLHLYAHYDTVQTQRIQSTLRWLRDVFSSVFHPVTEEPLLIRGQEPLSCLKRSG